MRRRATAAVLWLCCTVQAAHATDLLTFAQYAAKQQHSASVATSSSDGKRCAEPDEAEAEAAVTGVLVDGVARPGMTAAATEAGEEGGEADGARGFVTMLTNDVFVPGVLALLQSLQQHSAAWRAGTPTPSSSPILPA